MVRLQMNSLYRILKIRFSQTAFTKWGSWVLFIFAFADASFLPLPVTTYFLFLVLSNNEKSKTYLINVILGTVTGAIAGYLIGRFALLDINGSFSPAGQFIFNNIPGFSLSLHNKIQGLFSKWNFWILCVAVATPIPYGIFSIFSGALKINIFYFLCATIISQGVKFYLIIFSALNLAIQIKKAGKTNWRPAALAISAVIGVIIYISNLFKNLFQIN